MMWKHARGKMFKKIAITGGPCSGKTTGLAYLSEKLLDFGCRPLIVPEIATLVIAGGIPDINKICASNPNLYLKIQETIFFLMWRYEQEIEELARCFSNSEKVVVLCDRGKMDVKAYTDKDSFNGFLERAAFINEHEMCTEYDAVIHMVTAAKGAEDFYNTVNNRARREGVEEARLADDKTLSAWKNHPHLTIIDNENSLSFDHKVRRLLQAVLNILGIPHPVEIERKYLLVRAPSANLYELQDTQVSVIEQIYLAGAKNEEKRIRRRSFGDFDLFYETYKTHISPGVRVEVERKISGEEYALLAKNQDPQTRVIRKTRRCFIYADRRFELDEFLDIPGLCLLEVELADMSEKVKLPPFLQISHEVTDDPNYTNYAIAKKYYTFLKR